MPPPGYFMPQSFRADRSTSSRSNNVTTRTTTTTTTTTIPQSQLTLSTRSLNRRPLVSDTRDVAASPISPMSNSHRPINPKHSLKTEMSQSNSNSKIPASASGDKPHHAKLHKRGVPSTSSLPGQGLTHSDPTAAFVPYGDSTPDVATSTPKIKPYLRKMSVSKEDQGMIDLSKSRRENDRIAGLGIQELGPKTVADVSFTHNSKRGQQHGRNISNGSNNSSGSGNFRGAQAFVHPMAKTPRPYTPPSGISYANSLNEEEANESDDVVEDDFRRNNGLRSRRSMSVSSTPQNIPTPLSQSHTASDLVLIPKLTSTSQSNLSLVSNHSDKSSGKKARSRQNTELSHEFIPSPSSRTSFDKAFSFVGIKSDSADPQSRDDRIRAARQRFEEKEASKDRKYEKEASRRRELEAKRERKKSDATPPLKPALKQPQRRRKSSAAAQAGADDFRAMGYDDYKPAHAASLPKFGTRPGESEKADYRPRPIRQESKPDGNWMRFSTWFQTRMLSCGGSRA